MLESRTVTFQAGQARPAPQSESSEIKNPFFDLSMTQRASLRDVSYARTSDAKSQRIRPLSATGIHGSCGCRRPGIQGGGISYGSWCFRGKAALVAISIQVLLKFLLVFTTQPSDWVVVLTIAHVVAYLASMIYFFRFQHAIL